MIEWGQIDRGQGAAVGFDNLNLFDAVDGITSNALLPLCGLALSVFAGWCLPASLYEAELSRAAQRLTSALRLLLRWVAPAIIVAYVIAAQLARG